MHEFTKNQITSIFSDIIKCSDHKYFTNFSQSSFYLKNYSLNSKKCFMSIRGLCYRIKEERKYSNTHSLFQKEIKSKLIGIDNKTVKSKISMPVH